MEALVYNLFKSYLEKVEGNDGIITSKQLILLSYHRLDMLLFNEFNRFQLDNDDDKTKLLRKKEEVEDKNNAYIKEIGRLNEAFNRESINYVLLKGGALVLSEYQEIFYRYFGDLDFLINYDDIQKVERILHNQGYIQGNVVDGKIIKASRKDVLYQRLHTHEIYNMVKLDRNGSRFNVDVNFLFSWNGLEKSKDNFSLNYFYKNILHVRKMEVDAKIFDDEVQFIHLCSHLYNEAVFFSLSKFYISGTDIKELLLFRILDILIISIKDVNVNAIYTLADNINCIGKIEYVLSIIKMIMGQKYVQKFTENFSIYDEPVNYLYTKNGNKVEWPISIKQRLFDLESKEKALKQLAKEGTI